VLEAARLALRVSPSYSEATFTGGPREAAALSADLRRAHAFLGRLEQRWRALKALGDALALHQDAFLRHGPDHLRPLNRAQIARELGVHESTVSRSVAGKHAALPAGGVVPLSDFFTTSRDALDVLRNLVACEPRPLPDAMLAQAMRRRGYPVARRTVAKYRESLGIPPVSRRSAHGATP
jgi:RNA polymerase sigma-54 factor